MEKPEVKNNPTQSFFCRLVGHFSNCFFFKIDICSEFKEHIDSAFVLKGLIDNSKFVQNPEAPNQRRTPIQKAMVDKFL